MDKISAKKTAGLTAAKIVFLVFLSLLFLLFLGIWVFLNVYNPSSELLDFPDLDEWDFLAGAFIEHGMEGENRAENLDLSDMVNIDRKQGDSFIFLIVGRDESGFLTDVIMLLHFNVKDSKIALLSIPRDSWINNGLYTGRINAALSSGFNAARRAGKDRDESFLDGITFLRHVIRFTFGLPTDGYISMDLAGFRALVDAVGKVEVDVPQDMFYSDPLQNLHINLKKGLQELDGRQAEQLVRFRSGYVDADIGRIRTQQRFLAALARKMIRFDTRQMRNISDVLATHVTTNLTAGHIVWFAAKVTEVGLENIIMHTLPGEAAVTSGGASVLSLYAPESINIINEHYNPFLEEIPENNFKIYEIPNHRRYIQYANLDGITMDSFMGTQ